MTFIAGMILQDGSRQVTIYDAAPTVRNTRVLYQGAADGCDWGDMASNRSTDALARLMLAQVGLVAGVSVEDFVREFVRVRMVSGKMWIVSLSDIRLWVDQNQVIQ